MHILNNLGTYQNI